VIYCGGSVPTVSLRRWSQSVALRVQIYYRIRKWTSPFFFLLLSMKRTRVANNQEQNVASNSASTSGQRQKRAKQTKSCATCRKAKTRCEILDQISSDAPVQCHRCKVIKVHCSFSDVDKALVVDRAQAKVEQPSPSMNSTSSGWRGSVHTPPADLLEPSSPPNIPDDASDPNAPSNDREAHRPVWMWAFINGYEKYDWSQPLAAFQELAWAEGIQPQPESPGVAIHQDDCLEDILSSGQMQKHLDMCVLYFYLVQATLHVLI
jgi:hypothetical protein